MRPGIPKDPKKRREIVAVIDRHNARIASLKKPPPTTRNLDKRIRKINNRQELKHIDVTFTGTEMGSDTGSALNMILLNPLAIGNTNITRIGDKVTFTSIQCRGTVISTRANLTQSVWRIIIFRDMQSNGAAPVATNLLDTSVITQSVYSPYNTDYTDRFRVISDKRGVINPQLAYSTTIAGAVTTITESYNTGHKVNIKRQTGFISNYGLGNAGTIADISRNSVYMLLMSDKTLASDQGPLFYGGVRMYYKDD